MANIGGGSIAKIRVAEQGSAPATPASGYGYLYAKSDGKLYFKNDAGTEYDLTATGGGGGVSRVARGTTTAGGSAESMDPYKLYLKQITPGADGVIVGVTARIASDAVNAHGFYAAVYSDNGGVPGDVIAITPILGSATSNYDFYADDTGARWFSLPIACPVTASTPVWIGFGRRDNQANNPTIAYASGSDKTYTMSYPSAWDWTGGGTQGSPGRDYSLYATLLEG